MHEPMPGDHMRPLSGDLRPCEQHGTSEAAVVSDVLLSSHAVKRMIEPSQVADVVEFVCRDNAWAMTGSAITMDAGWLTH